MYNTPTNAPQVIHHVHVTKPRFTCCGMSASTASVTFGVILGIYHLLFYGIAVSIFAAGNAAVEQERKKHRPYDPKEEEEFRTFNTWVTVTYVVLALILVGYGLIIVVKYIRAPTLHIITMILVGVSIAVDLLVVGFVGISLIVVTVGSVGLLAGITFLGFIFVFLPALLKVILGIILEVSLCNMYKERRQKCRVADTVYTIPTYPNTYSSNDIRC